ncbi:hypothetical protein HMPREF1544_08032 [Mucor circinelloides 1006PhL]|uniref:Uncharacterized protein n=1 Tax=Mucor circinelloides f. circinelloides (strain 1006PhL) TaxID=1220926 RepID=S2JZD6_MUCC1|nr:hypothetical protein HMPREF1544_08032 [Mucor circinelloides 1006PhL]
MPDGDIEFLRKSASQLGGLSLAPRNYTWGNPRAGVEIHDYTSTDGYCDQYLGCVPNHVTITPQTSQTKTRTRIWPFTRLSFFRPKITTVPYEGIIVAPTIYVSFIDIEESTTAETTTTITSKPVTAILDTTIAVVTSVLVIVTSNSETIATYSETTETVTDPISTFETLTILTSDTTEVVTTTETDTLEIFPDTSCHEHTTHIVAVDSTDTETIV